MKSNIILPNSEPMGTMGIGNVLMLNPSLSSFTGMTLITASNWPTANKAFYATIYIPEDIIISKLYWVTGTATAGNIDVGIFRTTDLKKVISTGSQSLGTASAGHAVSVGPVVVRKGYYIMGCSLDTTTNARVVSGTTFNAGASHIGGCYEQTSAFPLPDPITPVEQTATFWIPYVGFYTSLTTTF